MAKEEGRRLKHGLTLVHPANHAFYRHLVGQIEQARRIGHKHRFITLSKVAIALERYPIPVQRPEDGANIAGVGDYTSKVFDVVLEKRGQPQVSAGECAAHAEKVFSRIRTFLDSTTFDQDWLSDVGDWKPKRYSNSWTFILVLALYAEGNSKLNLDAICEYSEKLRSRIPNCRLTNFAFLRALIDRSIVYFTLQSGVLSGCKTDLSVFAPRHKHRYEYGLTSLGHRLAADLISNCEVPISLDNNGLAPILQTQQSQGSPVGVDTSNVSLGGHCGTSTGVATNSLPILDSADLTVSASPNGPDMTGHQLANDSCDTGEVVDVPLYDSPKSDLSYQTVDSDELLQNSGQGGDNIEWLGIDKTPKRCWQQRGDNQGKQWQAPTLGDSSESQQNGNVTSESYRRSLRDYDDISQCCSQNSDSYSPLTQMSTNELKGCTTTLTIDHTTSESQPSKERDMHDATPVRNLDTTNIDEPIEIDSSSDDESNGRIVSKKSDVPERSQPTSSYYRFIPLKQRLQLRNGFDIDYAASEYEVVTVVDNRELHDSDGRYQRRLVELFAASGKTVVFRQLPLGDVIWVLRRKESSADDGQETNTNLGTSPLSHQTVQSQDDPGMSSAADNSTLTGEGTPTSAATPKRTPRTKRKKVLKPDGIANGYVLDWVLERKTTADLAASIIDGRYDDQKSRMLRLVGFKHVCYIFEDIEMGSAVGRVSALNKRVNSKAIASARIHTQLVTGFSVLRTTGMAHTVSSIVFMHMHIERCVHQRLREANTLSTKQLSDWLERSYMTFTQWDLRNRKQNQMTFRELFGRQLRAIPGCSATTTQAILDAWPTPHAFAHQLNRSNLAHINETLLQHRTKGKRAPVNNTLYSLCKTLYTKPPSF
ncbi:CCAAT-box DNA binding protein subunit B [Babesia ovis]|uniref:Crossover junction endonuclease MUS81 n=1 Tax=Babesia ovis TaxID=5869 RepID=A0A9W5WW22_BABOV|nr:CCAAT-box DNA binding protein subunit B [Babesia ovis]